MKKASLPPRPETIGIFNAKTHLSRLVRQARAGKSFIITQRGKPAAELRPIETPPVRRGKWGDMKGKIWIADDFCDPIEDMKEYME
ncbi:MAG TPA: type II toxin-antitoxin system prevent-host-death family antitoxin [Planctomycetota bacterium]|nr:type II toxin-antitoxin system prevent-host-death family antitoxin [Planctomycetota bacterium]